VERKKETWEVSHKKKERKKRDWGQRVCNGLNGETGKVSERMMATKKQFLRK